MTPYLSSHLTALGHGLLSYELLLASQLHIGLVLRPCGTLTLCHLEAFTSLHLCDGWMAPGLPFSGI